MARGPLPNPDARRRNAPTIPKTKLPVSGRKGRPPSPPRAYTLQEAGREWWKWAWGTPQATAWDKGAHYVVARRAQLEDDLALIDSRLAAKDLAELLGVEDEAIEQLEAIVGRLSAMAGGRSTVLKEMRELDKVLGLTPKAMADLRWEIVEDETTGSSAGAASKPSKAKRKKASDPRSRLSLVQ